MNQIEKTSLFEHYNEKLQKFGCYESDALCSCQKKFLKKKKIQKPYKAQSMDLSNSENFQRNQKDLLSVTRNDILQDSAN